MNARALALLLIAASPAVAGELCDTLAQEGNDAAAQGCRIDETDREIRREEADRRRAVDESIRRSQQQSDELMQQLELDDRLRDLRDRR